MRCEYQQLLLLPGLILPLCQYNLSKRFERSCSSIKMHYIHLFCAASPVLDNSGNSFCMFVFVNAYHVFCDRRQYDSVIRYSIATVKWTCKNTYQSPARFAEEPYHLYHLLLTHARTHSHARARIENVQLWIRLHIIYAYSAWRDARDVCSGNNDSSNIIAVSDQ